MSVLEVSVDLPGRLQLEHRFRGGVITGVFGPSGAGKTTLLRAIAGLDGGAGTQRLTVDGQDWADSPAEARPISLVFQDGQLFPHLDVAGNLAFAERFGRQRPGQALDRAEVVARCGLAQLLPRNVHGLSGGERQRVALARALLAAADVLLLDEPLSALDRASRRELLPVLAGLSGLHGLTVLYVSHDLAEVTALADDLLLLEHGCVLAAGSVADLTTRLDLPLAGAPDAFAALGAQVLAHDATWDLTRLDLGGGTELVVPGRHGQAGQPARVRVPARDVAVARQPLTDSSMLNCLPVTLGAIADGNGDHSAQVLLRLDLPGGQRLLARVTRRSHDHLALATGEPLWALVKSAALDATP